MNCTGKRGAAGQEDHHQSPSTLTLHCTGRKIHPDVIKRSRSSGSRRSTAFSPCCLPRSPPHGIQVKDTAKSQAWRLPKQSARLLRRLPSLSAGEAGAQCPRGWRCLCCAATLGSSAPGLGRARTGTSL